MNLPGCFFRYCPRKPFGISQCVGFLALFNGQHNNFHFISLKTGWQYHPKQIVFYCNYFPERLHIPIVFNERMRQILNIQKIANNTRPDCYNNVSRETSEVALRNDPKFFKFNHPAVRWGLTSSFCRRVCFRLRIFLGFHTSYRSKVLPFAQAFGSFSLTTHLYVPITLRSVFFL